MEPREAIEIARRFLEKEEHIAEDELLDEGDVEDIEEYLRHHVAQPQSAFSDDDETAKPACEDIKFASAKDVHAFLAMWVLRTSQDDWDQDRMMFCKFQFLLDGKRTERVYLVSGDSIKRQVIP